KRAVMSSSTNSSSKPPCRFIDAPHERAVLTLDALPWLLLAALVSLCWWSALGAKMKARRAARRACEQAQVRFIDELALRQLRPRHITYTSGHRRWRLR